MTNPEQRVIRSGLHLGMRVQGAAREEWSQNGGEEASQEVRKGEAPTPCSGCGDRRCRHSACRLTKERGGRE